MTANNKSLLNAQKQKNDEFYTLLPDIENELIHYQQHFKNKVVFCNCDDPVFSNFWKYFKGNFDFLQLKKLIATHYAPSDLFENSPAYKIEITRGKDLNNDGRHSNKDIIKTDLQGSGDFRSEECSKILKECDIVCTNPPFSLFREYVKQLVDYNKSFLIIGNFNAVNCKDIFLLLQNNRVWLGYSKRGMSFKTPSSNKLNSVNACWYTNLTHKKHNKDIVLYKQYTPEEYPKYGNYDAIEVSKVSDIPQDYTGTMGVPITFLEKYNPKQFDIVGRTNISTGPIYTNYRKTKKSVNLSHALVPCEQSEAACQDRETNLFYKATYRRILIKSKQRKNPAC